MHEPCIYHIQIQGQVDENDLNATSPLQMTVDQADPAATRLTFRADQSGLVGLIRHLHARGFVLLSLDCERQP